MIQVRKHLKDADSWKKPSPPSQNELDSPPSRRSETKWKRISANFLKRIAADLTLPIFPLLAKNQLFGIRYLIKEWGRFQKACLATSVTKESTKEAVLLRVMHENKIKLRKTKTPKKLIRLGILKNGGCTSPSFETSFRQLMARFTSS